MSNLRTVFVHSKPTEKKNKSRVTVAGIIDYEAKTIALHAARNNPKYGDVWTKKDGRERALGRAKKRPLQVLNFGDRKEAGHVFHAAAVEIIKHPNILARAKERREAELAYNRKSVENIVL